MDEHLLLDGGEQFLPFARSRLRALRAAGLNYASQQFVVDETTIRVSVSGAHDYIRISSSGTSVSGLVGTGETQTETVDGDKKHYMTKFWPRADLVDAPSWLVRGKYPSKLSKLDLTFNGTLERTSAEPTFNIYPDARESKYGKRAPASLYSGTMRKIVQVLLGNCSGVSGGEIRTEQSDRLNLLVSNANIPYDYTAAQSHGVLTCSDHTPEKPNVWVIEIGSQGILAWKMRTGGAASRPDLKSTLGYTPFPTRKPRTGDSDSDARKLRTLNPSLGAYAGQSPLYADCGWAFSYSGRAASNITLDREYSEGGFQTAVYSCLWDIVITEALVDGVMEPVSATITNTERVRVKMGSHASVTVPGISPTTETRSMMTLDIGSQIGLAPGVYTWPVYVFFGHNSDEKRVMYYQSESPTTTDTTYTDDTDFRFANGRWDRVRTLKDGSRVDSAVGGLIGYGLTGAMQEYSEALTINEVTVGDLLGLFLAPGRIWVPLSEIKTNLYSTTRSESNGTNLFIPFGDREAVYQYSIKTEIEVRSDAGKLRVVGMQTEGAMFYTHTTREEADGPYLDMSPTSLVVNTPLTVMGFSAINTSYPPPSTLAPTATNFYTGLGGNIEVPGDPGFGINEKTTSLRLITSASITDIPARSYDEKPNDDNDYSPSSFTTHFMDVSSEAFTGQVIASKGMNLPTDFVTTAPTYPQGDFGYRWCYWVGVPMYAAQP